MRFSVDDEPLEEQTASDAGQAWATFRQAREPIAWTLLVLAAIGVLGSAGQLLNLVGVQALNAVQIPATDSGGVFVAVPTFAVRASEIGPQFVDLGLVLLPVLAVILVTFAGGLTDRARQVALAAALVEVLGLGFGVISWLAALGTHTRPGVWFLFFAVDLAVAATALVFITAVWRSQALRPAPPRYQNYGESDDDEFDEDDAEFGGDEVEFGAP
jgi:hypothetical protein